MPTQVMGLIGEVLPDASPELLYDLIIPDYSQNPKRPNIVFQNEGNYPTCTVVFNQRRIYISTLNKPLTLFASAVAAYEDFSLTERDDGHFELTLDSRSFDPVNFAVAGQFGLILFSERNVWLVVNREGGGLSAGNAFIKNELGSGAKKDLTPLSILNRVIFISNLDNTPRALAPVNTTPNQFDTQDLSLYSHHLFGIHRTFIENENIASTFDPRHRSGAEIISWTYAGRPHKLLWAVRADGVLLSCTYSPEHSVNAWCRHATKGRFRSVQAVHEKNQDTVYMVVERGGHKFIERFSKRDVTQLEDSVPFDSAMQTKNQEPSDPTILHIYYFDDSEALLEDGETRVVFSSYLTYTGFGAVLPAGSATTFGSNIVGDYLKTRGGIYRVEGRANGRELSLSVVDEVPITDAEYFVHGIGDSRETAVRHPVFQWEVITEDTIKGAYHLQDQDIMTIEEKGGSSRERTVTDDRSIGSDGELATEFTGRRGLTVGLPFESYFDSLPLEYAQSEAVPKDRLKSIVSLRLRFIDSAAMRVGQVFKNLADAELTEDIDTYPVFVDGDGEPEVRLRTSVEEASIGASWDIDASLRVQSKLPFNIVGMIIEYDIGDVSPPGRARRGRLREDPRI